MASQALPIDEIYALAINFNPRSVAEIPASRQGAFAAWLAGDPARWRVIPKEPSVRPAQNVVQILAGEEGAGKSTYLGYLREHFEADSSNLVVYIDYTSVLGPDHQLSFVQHARTQIQRRLQRDREIYMKYRLKLCQLQLDSDFYMCTPIKDRFRGDIEGISDEVMFGDAQIQLALRLFERNEPLRAAQLAISAVQMLSSHRVILLIDNVDKHGRNRIREIARTFSPRLEADTVAVMAVRSYHALVAKRAFEEIRDVSIVDLDQDSNHIFDIANLRVKSATTWLSLQSQGVADPVTSVSSRLLDALTYIQADDSSRYLVSHWQNFNIRKMLPFLVRVCIRRYGTTAGTPSAQGIVYAELMETAMPKEARELYTPSFPVVRGRNYFVFLRLRVLAYLFKRKDAYEPPLLEEVVSDFGATFGLALQDVRDAIKSMTAPEDEEDAEDEDRLGVLIRVQDLNRDQGVKGIELLPAGRCLMESIISSCAFLEWNYDKAIQRNNLPAVDTLGKTPRQIRLDKAVAFVSGRILPLFEKEHPYMANPAFTNRTAKVERETFGRLTEYKRMFGYSTGHWFITELLDSLEGYARNRPDLDTSKLRDLVALAQGYTSNLDWVSSQYPRG